MNKTEVVNAIAEKTGVKKVDAKKSIDAFIEIIGDSMQNGDKIILSGFGSFAVTRKAERPGRNPRTGALIKIPAKNTIKFRPGNELNDKVNK